MGCNQVTLDKKKCLVISYGPVPTPEHTKVEGGGLRCWGLAKGLLANGNMDVTVAYHHSYKREKFTEVYEGVKVATWEINGIQELIAEYDSVLVSYCMGDISVKIADVVRTDQQLILDCYVPIYVEVSARATDNLDREYNAFHSDLGRWAHVLRRGDLFLCASEQQLRYYKGVLSAIGRINPATYGEELILIVPYGIYRDEPVATHKPITALIKEEGPKKLLWFGGIYPWFDLRMLVDAVALLNKKLPAKLIIVGAKNPFNDHPDFNRPYDELVDYIEKSNQQETVVMQDWVSFDDRANWYMDSDMVVVVNKIGEENELSWRTRLVDFMWANLPIITNGGDPLGEVLLTHDAAAHFTGLTPKQMATDMQAVLEDNSKLKKMRSNLKELKKNYYWDTVTAKLNKLILEHKLPGDRLRYGSYTLEQSDVAGNGRLHIAKLKQIYRKGRQLPGYARRHGSKNTYLAVRTKVVARLSSNHRRGPRLLFVSHQLDASGAPFVFMDIVEDIRRLLPRLPLEFHTYNPTDNENISRLNMIGVKPHIHIVKDIALPYVKGDVVILNTVAHSGIFKHHLFSSVDAGVVNKVIWYVHEDEPELIFDSSEKKKIMKLLQKDKMIIFSAAKRTVENYQACFENTKNIRMQTYKYAVPEKFQKVRSPEDFNKLKFILTGTVGDGRKGQLPIFYAFKAFLDLYYTSHPETYRDFKLDFVGIDKDFLSRQIEKHALRAFGDRFNGHGRVSHQKSLELMQEANVTFCYSMRECLPLFVFEGMAAGHPILRNDCSGMEEQLVDGKNGFLLDSSDYSQIITTIEKILNKQTTSNAQLASMSKLSNKIAISQAENDYHSIINAISDAYKTTTI